VRGRTSKKDGKSNPGGAAGNCIGSIRLIWGKKEKRILGGFVGDQQKVTYLKRDTRKDSWSKTLMAKRFPIKGG